MWLRNCSGLPIPRELWRALACGLELDANLPAAARDEFGFYGPRKTLRIVVHSPGQVAKGQIVTTGTYCYGRIDLRPCRVCTVGFLTRVYLHELVHAWLDQYREDFYIGSDSCPLAERFALAAFRHLGGTKRANDLCSSHRLDIQIASGRLSGYYALTESLVRRSPRALQRWPARPLSIHPPQKKRC